MLVATWSQTLLACHELFCAGFCSKKWDMVYGFESEMGVNQKYIKKTSFMMHKKIVFCYFLGLCVYEWSLWWYANGFLNESENWNDFYI